MSHEKRSFSIFKRITFLTIIGALVAVGFMPMFFSTQLGSSFLSFYAKKRYQTKLTIEGLNLSWFQSQSARKISLIPDDQSFALSLENIENTSSLVHLFISRSSPPLSQIEFLSVDIDQEKFKKGAKTSFNLKSLLHHLFIKNGTIKILESSGEMTTLDHVQLSTQLQGEKVLFYTQGHSLSKNIQGNFESFFSLNQRDFHIEGKVNATHFPVITIDDLLSTNGLLQQVIGHSISARGDFVINDEKLNVSADVTSDYFKGSIHTKDQKDFVALEKPSFVSLTLTDSSIKSLSERIDGLNNLSLMQPGSIQLFIDSLKVPYKSKILDFKNLAAESRLFSSSLNFLTRNNKTPLTINPSSLTFLTKGLSEDLKIQVKSSLNYNLKNPSYINSNLELIDLFNDPKLSKVSAKITKVPFAIVDALFPKDQSLSALLGDTLDLSISTENKESGPIFTLDANSTLFSLSSFSLLASEGSLTLISPAGFSYAAPKEALSRRLAPYHFGMQKEAFFRGKIESFNLLLEDCKNLSFTSISSKLAFESDQLSFMKDGIIEPLNLRYPKITLDLIKKNKLEVFFESDLSIGSSTSFVSELLGNKIHVKSQGVLENFGNLSIPYFKIFSLSDKSSFGLSFSLTENLSKVTLLEAVSGKIQLSSLLFNHLFGVSFDQTEFNFLTPFNFSINAPSFYITKEGLKDLQIKGEGLLDKVRVMDKISGNDFEIGKLALAFDGNTEKLIFNSLFSTEISSKLSPSSKGVIKGSLMSREFTGIDFPSRPYDIEVSVENFPTTLVDVALGLNSASQILLGESLNSHLSIKENGSIAEIDGKVTSQNLNFSYQLQKQADELTLKTPMHGTWSIQRDSYSAFEEIFSKSILSEQTFAISHDTQIFFDIEKLKWNLTKGSYDKKGSLADKTFAFLNQHLKKSLLDATLRSPHINIVCQKTHQYAYLKNLLIECHKSEGETPFNFAASSDVIADPTSKESHGGHMVITTTLQNIQKEKEVLSSKISATLQHFPTLIFDIIAKAFGADIPPPSIFLGKKAHINFDGKFEDLNGPYSIKIDSKDCKGACSGLIGNNILKLSSNLTAELSITPELSSYFLSRMNIFVQQSNSLIKLNIDPRGFYIPLDPFNFSDIQIRKMQLDLGQFNCMNKGNPQEIGSVFKLGLAPSQMVNLWFTPMEMSLSSGVLTIDRTEVLYNLGYEVCFWGNLNIPGNYVSMTLGLTEQSLRKAFGVRGLPKSFVLQLPVEGPLNNITINKEVTATRVALLLAKTTGLTNYGGLWGGITSFLSEIANDQTMVPPAKPPYPWTDKLSTFEKEEEQQRKVNIIR